MSVPVKRADGETTAPDGAVRRSDRDQWLALGECDEQVRVLQMASRYREIAALDGEERKARLRALIHVELAGDAATLGMYTAARLRAWAQLGQTNSDAVRRVAEAADEIFAELPGTSEMRRAIAVQAVFDSALSSAEQDLLYQLLPGFHRYVSIRRSPFRSSRPTSTDDTARDHAEEATGSPWSRLIRRLTG